MKKSQKSIMWIWIFLNTVIILGLCYLLSVIMLSLLTLFPQIGNTVTNIFALLSKDEVTIISAIWAVQATLTALPISFILIILEKSGKTILGYKFSEILTMKLYSLNSKISAKKKISIWDKIFICIFLTVSQVIFLLFGKTSCAIILFIINMSYVCSIISSSFKVIIEEDRIIDVLKITILNTVDKALKNPWDYDRDLSAYEIIKTKPVHTKDEEYCIDKLYKIIDQLKNEIRVKINNSEVDFNTENNSYDFLSDINTKIVKSKDNYLISHIHDAYRILLTASIQKDEQLLSHKIIEEMLYQEETEKASSFIPYIIIKAFQTQTLSKFQFDNYINMLIEKLINSNERVLILFDLLSNLISNNELYYTKYVFKNVYAYSEDDMPYYYFISLFIPYLCYLKSNGDILATKHSRQFIIDLDDFVKSNFDDENSILKLVNEYGEEPLFNGVSYALKKSRSFSFSYQCTIKTHAKTSTITYENDTLKFWAFYLICKYKKDDDKNYILLKNVDLNILLDLKEIIENPECLYIYQKWLCNLNQGLNNKTFQNDDLSEYLNELIIKKLFYKVDNYEESFIFKNITTEEEQVNVKCNKSLFFDNNINYPLEKYTVDNNFFMDLYSTKPIYFYATAIVTAIENKCISQNQKFLDSIYADYRTIDKMIIEQLRIRNDITGYYKTSSSRYAGEALQKKLNNLKCYGTLNTNGIKYLFINENVFKPSFAIDKIDMLENDTREAYIKEKLNKTKQENQHKIRICNSYITMTEDQAKNYLESTCYNVNVDSSIAIATENFGFYVTMKN